MKKISLILFLSFLFCKKENYQSNVLNEMKKIESHVVYIHSPNLARPNGTGIILDKTGKVLTCYHVISAIEDSVEILLNDQKTRYKAKVLFKEEIFDLLVLQSEYKNNLNELEWTSLDEINISDNVFMFGSPYGLTGSFLQGKISGLDRTKTSLQFPDIPFIQTQGLSFPGNSGGAVFHETGKIIGINQSTFGFSTGTGIGLTIPTGFVKAFLEKHKQELEQN
jgi:S1-C subfamily serine protease